MARRLFKVLVIQMPKSSSEGSENDSNSEDLFRMLKSSSEGSERDSHSDGLHRAQGRSTAKELKDRRNRSELLWKRNAADNIFQDLQISCSLSRSVPFRARE
jgi:hypothetical protein